MARLNKIFYSFGKLFWVIFFALVILFWLAPEIDMTVAALFYDGHIFTFSQNPFVLFLHKYTQVFTVGVGVFLLTILVATVAIKKQIVLPKKAVIFLLISLILGPGLVVNTVFKDHFGRARPAQIKEFGGQKEFTRAFEISNNCQTNCSFTCGHAAVAFWFLTFGFVARDAWRARIFALGILFGAAVGIGRMAQGGHFLSDVIFSFFFVYIVSKVTYEVVYNES